MPVNVLFAAANELVKVRPLTVNTSFKVVRLSGLRGSERLVVRAVVKVDVIPPVVMVELFGSGVCMEKRGSGP